MIPEIREWHFSIEKIEESLRELEKAGDNFSKATSVLKNTCKLLFDFLEDANSDVSNARSHLFIREKDGTYTIQIVRW